MKPRCPDFKQSARQSMQADPFAGTQDSNAQRNEANAHGLPEGPMDRDQVPNVHVKVRIALDHFGIEACDERRPHVVFTEWLRVQRGFVNGCAN
jgi:hypothetical protein